MHKLHLYLCNIPYPNDNHRDSKLISIINLFNKTLDDYIKNTHFKILDIHSYTKNNNSFYIDNHHLSFNLYERALLNIL